MPLPDHAPTSLHETELVNALLPQAVKILQNDFTLSGIPCDLSTFTGDVFALREQIKPLIESTNGPGSEVFYRLLYRADIPEMQVAEALSSGGKTPVSTLISELLIVRSLQKAYYRVKFM